MTVAFQTSKLLVHLLVVVFGALFLVFLWMTFLDLLHPPAAWNLNLYVLGVTAVCWAGLLSTWMHLILWRGPTVAWLFWANLCCAALNFTGVIVKNVPLLLCWSLVAAASTAGAQGFAVVRQQKPESPIWQHHDLMAVFGFSSKRSVAWMLCWEILFPAMLLAVHFLFYLASVV